MIIIIKMITLRESGLVKISVDNVVLVLGGVPLVLLLLTIFQLKQKHMFFK